MDAFHHPAVVSKALAALDVTSSDAGLARLQVQRQGHRHLVARQGQRDQRLAVKPLALHRGVLGRHATEYALLRQRRGVRYQHSVTTADQTIGVSEQLRLQRRLVPDTGGYEVV